MTTAARVSGLRNEGDHFTRLKELKLNFPQPGEDVIDHVGNFIRGW